MALVPITVTEQFPPVAPGATPPSGMVVFTLNERLVTGAEEVEPAPIYAPVVVGALRQPLYATPLGTWYVVQIMFDGYPPQPTLKASVPANAPTGTCTLTSILTVT